jgi:hypothetical protein
MKFQIGNEHFSKNLWNVIHSFKGIIISHLTLNIRERFLEYHFKTSFTIKVRNEEPFESADVAEMLLLQIFFLRKQNN